VNVSELTAEGRADLVDRLRNRPGYVTAVEKQAMADVLDRISIVRQRKEVVRADDHCLICSALDFVEGR